MTIQDETNYSLKGKQVKDIANRITANHDAIGDIGGELASKQDALSQAQLDAVNSGIDSTKVGQIATNATDIDSIEGKIPAQATSSNQLADKDFVNSSVATNTANYISNNGEPFTSLAQLEAYSGDLSNNDYAFVVGTDSAGNTTYTRYKYVADTQEWAEEYVLNNSSFTANQWAAINSGITSGDVTKLSGIEAGAEVNAIDSISVNGTAVTPDANKNVDLTIDEGIKTLTTADYNYPETGTKTAVAIHLLSAGIYQLGEKNVAVRLGGENYVFAKDSMFYVLTDRNNSYKGVLYWGNTNRGVEMKLYTNTGSDYPIPNPSDANILQGYHTVDNLTSTSPRRPLSANQGRGLKGLIDSIAIRGAGAPTTSTVGTVGQLYEDGTNGDLYQLKSIDITVTPNTYNWEKFVTRTDVNIVQNTGASTTDIMSQNATTKLVYSDFDGTSRQCICIGLGAISAPPSGYSAIAIGTSSRTSSYNSIAIGSDANATSSSSGGYGIAIGYRAETPTAGNAIAIGAGDNISSHKTTASGARSIAIGPQAHALHDNSIALGAGAETSAIGEVNIGSGSSPYGYNNSAYRLLSGVYDPQSAHDAATKGYVDSVTPVITMSSTDPGEGVALDANHFIAYYE